MRKSLEDRSRKLFDRPDATIVRLLLRSVDVRTEKLGLREKKIRTRTAAKMEIIMHRQHPDPTGRSRHREVVMVLPRWQ